MPVLWTCDGAGRPTIDRGAGAGLAGCMQRDERGIELLGPRGRLVRRGDRGRVPLPRRGCSAPNSASTAAPDCCCDGDSGGARSPSSGASPRRRLRLRLRHRRRRTLRRRVRGAAARTASRRRIRHAAAHTARAARAAARHRRREPCDVGWSEAAARRPSSAARRRSARAARAAAATAASSASRAARRGAAAVATGRARAGAVRRRSHRSAPDGLRDRVAHLRARARLAAPRGLFVCSISTTSSSPMSTIHRRRRLRLVGFLPSTVDEPRDA